MNEKLKDILEKYDVEMKDDRWVNFHSVSKNDLMNIVSLKKTLLQCRHKNSPTIEELVSHNDPITFNGCLQIENGIIEDVFIYSVNIPIEQTYGKPNYSFDEMGYRANSLQRISQDNQDYISLWWD